MGQKTIFSGAGQGLKSARRYGQWSNPPGAGHEEREAIRKCQCQGLFEQISWFIVAVVGFVQKQNLVFVVSFFLKILLKTFWLPKYFDGGVLFTGLHNVAAVYQN